VVRYRYAIAMRIRDLVSRRTDLSAFLVHLTRAEGAESGRARLEGIIASGRIEARSAYGQARGHVEGNAAAGLGGANPVWYVDITPGHDWLTNPLNALIAGAIAEGAAKLEA